MLDTGRTSYHTGKGRAYQGQVCQFDALYPHPPDTLGTPSRYARPLRATADPSRLAAATSAPAERGAAAGRARPRADNRRPGLRRDVDAVEAVCVHRARGGGQRQRRVRLCPEGWLSLRHGRALACLCPSSLGVTLARLSWLLPVCWLSSSLRCLLSLSLLLRAPLTATACCHRRLLGFCRQTLQNHPAAATIAAIGMPQASARLRNG